MQQPNDKQVQMLKERRIASVATIDAHGMPHLTSVWFLYEEGSLYLAIPSASAKGRNLARNPRIAVMIDIREHYREAGLTAIGNAEILSGEAASPVVERLHRKYLTDSALEDPGVGPVFAAVDDIAVRLQPARWIAWDMAELDGQAFGGAIARNRYLRDLAP